MLPSLYTLSSDAILVYERLTALDIEIIRADLDNISKLVNPFRNIVTREIIKELVNAGLLVILEKSTIYYLWVIPLTQTHIPYGYTVYKANNVPYPLFEQDTFYCTLSAIKSDKVNLAVRDVTQKDIDRVFDEYMALRGRIKRTPSRISKIKSALRYYPVEDLIKAIKGIKLSDWHNGDNPNNKKYLSLSVIFRDVEHFIDLYERS